MDTVSLSPAGGVEVRDVQLRRFDDRSFQALERLFDAASLLLFRNQDPSYDEGRDFIARFGPLVEGVQVVTNEAATGRGELEFHSERSFQRQQPLRGLALYAREIPDSTGATLFVNCAAAYQALPDDLRQNLLTIDTVHRYDPRIRLGDAYENPGNVPEGGWHTIHPAVWRHPVTGTPILYMSPWFTRGIVGMEDDAGSALLARLLDHLSNPDFLYRHEWQPNDFVLWDNFVMIHAREPYDESKARVLWKYEFGLREGFSLPEPRHAATAS